MLYSVFDEQAQRKQYDIAIRAEERAKGYAEGYAEGRAEEREENIKNAVIVLRKFFPTLETMAETIMEIFKLDRQTATAKVTAYWN